MKKPRVLLFDLETACFISGVWRLYEADTIEQVADRYIMAGCAKWLGEKKVMRFALPDYTGYVPARVKNRNGSITINSTRPMYDYDVVLELWELLDEADIVIAHNGDRFDCRVFAARAAIHGLGPPSPYRTIDTLKAARRFFDFGKNNLDALGEFLGVGRKAKHSGQETWRGCELGIRKEWKTLVKYCVQDVRLLEEIYLSLLPWMKSHPNLSIYSDNPCCPKCGSMSIRRRGTRETNTSVQHRFVCNDCGGWSYTIYNEKSLEERRKMNRSC